MALWIVFAALTAVTILAIAAPLLKGSASDRETTAGREGASDKEVYRSQLEELEAEKAQGLIGEAEYTAARIEISRRLLHASQESAEDAVAGPASAGVYAKAFAYLAVVAFPAGVLSLYLHYGSPDLPGQPLQARLEGPVEKQSVDALIFQVEQRLRLHPEDGVGWGVVAPVYLKMGRYEDAAEAFDRAIRLKGENGRWLVGRGEALVFANQGAVTPDARASFKRALEVDPEQHIAGFWLGISFEQIGMWDKAANAYRELMQKNLPEELRVGIATRLKNAEEQARKGPSAPSAQQAPMASNDGRGGRGPSADDVKAAQQMTQSDRSAMINQMVERLATRLNEDGSNLTDWLKLVRAYTVLGRKDDALKALTSARKNFAGNTEALGQIDELARSLGLSS
jgi:cytochrome c-type biogenesis protein CcmH